MSTEHLRHTVLVCCTVTVVSLGAYAQEHVPNGGFEQITQCPDLQSQLDRTAFWFDPSEGGTPDLYHACGAPQYAVPDNAVGNQEVVSGEAYAGIFLWFANVLTDWREYLEVGLTAPLIPGQCYHFRMYANLGDFSGMTTDDLGVHFSVDSILSDDPYPPGMAPHIALGSGTFLEREQWTVLEGNYTASGGERFLTIGNFRWDGETSVMDVPGGPPNTGEFTYCLVDSVSLKPCGAIALGMENSAPDIVQGAMPFQERLDIRMDLVPGGTFRVYDALGRILCSGNAASASIDTASWPPGTFILELRSTQGRVWRRSVIKR